MALQAFSRVCVQSWLQASDHPLQPCLSVSVCGTDNLFFPIWTWINDMNYYWKGKGFPGWGEKSNKQTKELQLHSTALRLSFSCMALDSKTSKPSPNGESPEGLIFVPHRKVKKTSLNNYILGKIKKKKKRVGEALQFLSSAGHGVKAGVCSKSGQEKLKIQEGNHCFSLLRTRNG